jgi:hypothetical protein
MNLKATSIQGFTAKYTKIHPKICGKAMMKIDLFLPILFAAYPKIKVPTTPPTVNTDPIIEASLLLIGPDFKGV